MTYDTSRHRSAFAVTLLETKPCDELLQAAENLTLSSSCSVSHHPPLLFLYFFFNSSVGSVGSHAGRRQKVSMWWSLEAALLTVGVACRHISAALVLIGIWTWPWVGVSSTPPGSVSLPPAGANSSLRSRTWADLTKNRGAVILFHRQIKCERQKGGRRRLCARQHPPVAPFASPLRSHAFIYIYIYPFVKW